MEAFQKQPPSVSNGWNNLDDNQAATHALEAGETYPTRKKLIVARFLEL